MSLKAGDRAPGFRLPDQTGQEVSLEDVLAEGPVMLVFYPGDFTPVCTKQLCGYRDHYGEFRALGVQILGISDDPVEKHAAFKEEKNLPFPLLADPNKEVIDAYAGSSLLSMGHSRRANYIISADGIVRYVYVEPVSLLHRKSGELLERLAELKQRGELDHRTTSSG